jgi:hypothetical protein
MAETCRRTTTCLYVIVPDYSAVAGLYTVKIQNILKNVVRYKILLLKKFGDCKVVYVPIFIFL